LPAIRYDVSDVESGAGEQAPPKIYKAKITAVEHRTEKSDGTKIEGKGDFHVTVSVGDGFAPLHSYIGLYDATAWKLREFTDALGLPAKGSLDPKKLVGKECRVQVTKDEYDGAYKARLKTWLKAKDDEADEEDEDEEETDEEEVDEEEETEEDEPEEEEEEVEEEEEPEAEADPLDEMDRAELKKHIKSEGLEIKVTTKMSDDDIREAIRAEDTDDYDEWPVGDLKEEFGKRDLSLKKGAKATKANYIAALRADDNEEPF
jgi:hypothetical protein